MNQKNLTLTAVEKTMEDYFLNGAPTTLHAPVGLLNAHPRLAAIASLTFRFMEYNPRRAARGVRAARVEVMGDGPAYWLWMNASDVRKNMAAHGECEELKKALAAIAGKVAA